MPGTSLLHLVIGQYRMVIEAEDQMAERWLKPRLGDSGAGNVCNMGAVQNTKLFILLFWATQEFIA